MGAVVADAVAAVDSCGNQRTSTYYCHTYDRYCLKNANCCVADGCVDFVTAAVAAFDERTCRSNDRKSLFQSRCRCLQSNHVYSIFLLSPIHQLLLEEIVLTTNAPCNPLKCGIPKLLMKLLRFCKSGTPAINL